MFELRVIRWRVETNTTCPVCEALVGWSSKGFCSHVCEHFLGINVLGLSILSFLFLLTERGMNSKVFGSWCHSSCGSDSFDCLVVLVDGDGINEVIVEGGGEVAKDLGSDVGATEATEFSIGRVEGHSGGLFAFPSDGSTSDGEDIAEHGSVLDEVARVTRVSEDGWFVGEGNVFLIIGIPDE